MLRTIALTLWTYLYLLFVNLQDQSQGMCCYYIILTFGCTLVNIIVLSLCSRCTFLFYKMYSTYCTIRDPTVLYYVVGFLFIMGYKGNTRHGKVNIVSNLNGIIRLLGFRRTFQAQILDKEYCQAKKVWTSMK